MRKQLTVLAFSLSAVMASSAFAGDIKPLHGTAETLGSTGTAADIYRFRCGTQAGINQAVAQVTDLAGVVNPIVQVQIATSTSATCGAFGTARGDGTATTGDGDATPSAFTPAIVAASGTTYYCVKVSKAAGRQAGAATATTTGAESYEVNHHCQDSANTATHPASTLIATVQNQ